MKLTASQIHRRFSFTSLVLNTIAAIFIIIAFSFNSWYKDYASTERYLDGQYYYNEMFIELGFSHGNMSGHTTDTEFRQHYFKTEYKVACYESSCLFSCGKTKEERQSHAELASKGILNGVNYCGHNTTFSLGYTTPPAETTSSSTNETSGSTSTSISTDSTSITLSTTLDPDIYYQIVTEMQTRSQYLMSTLGLYISSGAICVNLILCFVNIIIVPNMILSWVGMHISNGIGAIFGLASIICYGLQYANHMGQNVLVLDAQDGWSSESDNGYWWYPSLQISYWFFVSAVILLCINILLLIFGHIEENYALKSREDSLVKVEIPRPVLNFTNAAMEEDH